MLLGYTYPNLGPGQPLGATDYMKGVLCELSSMLDRRSRFLWAVQGSVWKRHISGVLCLCAACLP